MVLPGFYPKQYHLLLFSPIVEAVNSRYDYLLNLYRSFATGSESPCGSSVLSFSILDSFLQYHVFHLYGAHLLASINIARLVPFVNDFPPLFSHFVPSLHT